MRTHQQAHCVPLRLRLPSTATKLQQIGVTVIPICFSEGSYDDDDEGNLGNLLKVKKSSQISNFAASFNIMKSFVGVGILALPYATQQGGLWFSVLMFLVIALVSNYGIKLLMACQEALHHEGQPAESYDQIGEQAYGTPGSVAVRFVLILSQLGFCTSYIVFIALGLQSFYAAIDLRLYMAMLLPFLLAAALLRSLKFLSPLAAVGIGAVVGAIAVVCYYGFTHFHPSAKFPFMYWETSPNFFGLAVFGFEGITLALPMKKSMKKPQDYMLVLDISMIIVTLAYIFFAVAGYLSFGDHVQAPITKNLPDKNIIVKIVQILLMIEVFVNYPIQLFPVTEICEVLLIRPHASWFETRRNLIRAALVLLTGLLAAFIPEFALVCALVGAFSNTAAGFILPPILYLKLVGKSGGYANIILCIFVLVFGIVGGGIATTVTILEIIRTNFS